MSHFPSIDFKLPKYCSHYKSMIVEELVSNPHTLLLHYGHCSVIGRTSYDEHQSKYYLESLKLIGLDK